MKAFALLSALLPVATANAAFIIDQPNGPGAFGNASTGQSFTPSVGMVTDPGPSTTTIDLTGMSFWTNGGSADVSGGLNNVFLLIYQGAPSFTGSGPFTPTNLVGASTNSIDHNPNLSAGTELAWTFNNLTLNYTTTYFAVIASNTTGSLGINDVGISFQNRAIVSGGPYAGGNGLINNFVADGNVDLKFKATFANPVPEPGTLALAGLGLTMLVRRRKVHA